MSVALRPHPVCYRCRRTRTTCSVSGAPYPILPTLPTPLALLFCFLRCLISLWSLLPSSETSSDPLPSAPVRSSSAPRLCPPFLSEEGFYAFPTSSPNAASANPAVWAWSIGQDFIDDHSNPNIDFATTHLWPENWGIFSTTSLAPVEFAERWLWAHIRDAHRMLGKPLLVEEFGRSQQLDAFGGTRDAFYDAIFRLVEKARAEGYGVYGTAFWALFSDAAGSVNDQYGIFPGDIGVMGRVARHSAAMRNLSRAVLAQEQPPPVSAAAGGRGEWWGQDGPPACGRASSSSMG